ncbi:M91 family zinc metallopeptidase [Ornithinimicrobium pratense]|uniref:M91 family zinc metallopeptidase n=1 Tax=Ornithinimicrobium pratense TaxID=2593973 RepID=UPI001787E704|nr:M91 family zinc metallopeptidase [Ornithinimicrobium pratense]
MSDDAEAVVTADWTIDFPVATPYPSTLPTVAVRYTVRNDGTALLVGVTSERASDAGYVHRPPSLVLHHELGHINQYRSQGGRDHWLDDDGNKLETPGNSQYLIEMQNVDLDWSAHYDEVPEADGANYDFRLTEIGFREELGIPSRDRY